MLDPSRIEGDDCPLNLQRLMDLSRSNIPYNKGEKVLRPKEIVKMVKKLIKKGSKVVRKRYVSKKFLEQVEEFFVKKADKLEKMRKSYGKRLTKT